MVDDNDLIEIFRTLQSLVFAGNCFGAVKLVCQDLTDYLVYKRGFTAARNAGNTAEGAEWDFNVYVFKIIFGGALDRKDFAVALSALCRYGYLFSAGKVVGGYRFGTVFKLLDGWC